MQQLKLPGKIYTNGAFIIYMSENWLTKSKVFNTRILHVTNVSCLVFVEFAGTVLNVMTTISATHAIWLGDMMSIMHSTVSILWSHNG